jgi:hypothetical protein
MPRPLKNDWDRWFSAKEALDFDLERDHLVLQELKM